MIITLLVLASAAFGQQTWTGAELLSSGDWSERSYASPNGLRSYVDNGDGSLSLLAGPSTSCHDYGGAPMNRCIIERTFELPIDPATCGDELTLSITYRDDGALAGGLDNDLFIGFGEATRSLSWGRGDGGVYMQDISFLAYETPFFINPATLLSQQVMPAAPIGEVRELTLTVDAATLSATGTVTNLTQGTVVTQSPALSSMPSIDYVWIMSGDRHEQYTFYEVSLIGCDTDSDGDGVPDGDDVCAGYDDTADDDDDGTPDGCDACVGLDVTGDYDGDGYCDDTDNCPVDANASQADADGDGIGDVCETDSDQDGVYDDDDNCPDDVNVDQADNDADGLGDVCDDDDDDDGVADADDLCPLIADATNADSDGDGLGDICDGDDDGDGVDDSADSCPGSSLDAPTDIDGCTGEQFVHLACPDGDAATCAIYTNHGDYVSCVSHATNDAKDAGLITGKEKASIVKDAAKNGCY